ncbi:MAG: hypothetical protein CSA65_04765 [Proteobacteria bacterium]|nr:MAG: hypothetical protein CSA65_04765 [Pseudomonadota bacterium]
MARAAARGEWLETYDPPELEPEPLLTITGNAHHERSLLLIWNTTPFCFLILFRVYSSVF